MLLEDMVEERESAGLSAERAFAQAGYVLEELSGTGICADPETVCETVIYGSETETECKAGALSNRAAAAPIRAGKGMPMDPGVLLSVIVPAYNVSEWLPRCLDSILAQTYRNLEVLMIDDGSTDETPQIIDRYAQMDQRFIAIHQQNRGLVESRERGIREAR